MKFLISLFSILTLNIAQAEMGTLESYFSPSGQDKVHPKVVNLWLQNSCNQDVLVAIRSETPYYVWETKGYMRIHSGQVVHATNMVNDIYFLNAFTADRTIRWEGPHTFEIHGRYVRAALVELPRDYGGNWTTVLYCY